MAEMYDPERYATRVYHLAFGDFTRLTETLGVPDAPAGPDYGRAVRAEVLPQFNPPVVIFRPKENP
jgi:hypothetical protein